MGRRSRTRALAVWMNGELVGHWRIPARGEDEFHYARSWFDSPACRPLSLSMPLRPWTQPYRGPVVRDFFDNLLPDTDTIRRRIQARFGAASTTAFDLLAEIGRDCVGAVALVPEDAPAPDPRKIEGKALDEGELQTILQQASGSYPLGQRGGDFRISLAGAQEKTALLWHDGRWLAPQGPTPTTHIFKLPMGAAAHGVDLSLSVENEWLCHQVLTAYEIPVAACEMASFGEQRALVVTRFDRRLSKDGSWIARIPQEDLCQATRTPSALKYENDGGPGILQIMELLVGSDQANTDRVDFFRTQVLFWMLCAIDGHAKNFSIFIEPGGRFRLTPRYDVLSAYPVLGHGAGKLSRHDVKMAMAAWGKNRQYGWLRIRRRHWERVGADCGLPEAPAVIDDLVQRTPAAVEAVAGRLPPDFPAEVAEPILKGLAAAARALEAGS